LLRLGIDHAVIAVRDLDRAARAFVALGFTLTPRGVHSIGSQNHCIMLGSTYIELLEPSSAHPWLDYYREFVAAADGLAALALSTPDANASYRDLLAQGIVAQPPMDLVRPVKIGEEGRVARFRIVQVSRAVFLCEHLTRELVWRREWQAHANGARELAALDFPHAAPFGDAPANVRWRAPAVLQLEGLVEKSAVLVHGVKLACA
jgi:catechol 2,3-dioxygenase-like lactoylglutathione lyase family enzyme